MPIAKLLINTIKKIVAAYLVFILIFMIALRLLFFTIPKYQQSIISWIEKKLNAEIVAEKLVLNWNKGYPVVKLSSLKITGNSSFPSLVVDGFKLEIDLLRMFLYLKNPYKSIAVDNAKLHLENIDGNSWILLGVNSLATSLDTDYKFNYSKIMSYMLQSNVTLKQIVINLHKKSVVYQIKIPEFLVYKNQKYKELVAILKIGNGILDISGKTVRINSQESWQGGLKTTNLSTDVISHIANYYPTVMHDSITTLDSQWIFDYKKLKIVGDITFKNTKNSPNYNNNSIKIDTKFFYEAKSITSFNLWLENLFYTYQDKICYNLNSTIFISKGFFNDQAISLSASQIDAQQISSMIKHMHFVDNKYINLIASLQPTGLIKDLHCDIHYNTNKQVDNEIILTAHIANLSTSALNGIPGFKNISGNLQVTENGGTLWVYSDSFSIYLPKIYDNSLDFNNSSAKINWIIKNDFVELIADNIKLIADAETVEGKLKLDIPKTKTKTKNTHLSMVLSVLDTNISVLPKYLPKDRITSSNLNNWLKGSLHDADVKLLTYLYHGSVAAGQKNNFQWRLLCFFDSLKVDIPNYWPSITNATGKLSINNYKADILATKANFVGSDVFDLKSSVLFSKNYSLLATAKVKSENKNITDFLLAIPDNTLKSQIQKLAIDGTVLSDIKMLVSLQDSDSIPAINVNSTLKNITINHEKHDLQFKNINGLVNYNKLTGINTENISGYFMDKKFTTEIRSIIDKNTLELQTINGVFASEILISDLSKSIDIPLNGILSGKTNYRSTWDFYPKSNNSHITIDTDLIGTASLLPSPFNKQAEDKRQLSVIWDIDSNKEQKIISTIDGDNTIAVDIKQSNSKNKSKNNISTVLSGSIDKTKITPWLDLLKQQSSKQPTDFSINNLQIQECEYEGIKLTNANITTSKDDKNIDIKITSDCLNGSISLPQDKLNPIVLNFDNIIINDATADAPITDIFKKINNLDWQLIPEFNVSIADLTYKDYIAKKINFNFTAKKEILAINNFSADINLTTINCNFDWIKNETIENCWLQGSVNGDNKKSLINKLLAEKGIITANKAHIDYALSWKGNPAEVSKTNLEGDIKVLLKDGKINKAEKNAQILKPLGLFNTEALAKRLRLDFSDLFSSGYVFDTLNGNFIFSCGKIYTTTPVLINGSSAKQAISGIIDLTSNSLELDLTITLPLVANLPIVSLLLASQPMLSLLIFIADKAIGKQINALANINYRIYGSTDSPQIVLQKLFK